MMGLRARPVGYARAVATECMKSRKVQRPGVTEGEIQAAADRLLSLAA